MTLDRHQLRKVLHVSTSGAAGAYDHRGWSLLEQGDNCDPQLSRYVSIHESIHEDLSASTAYGLLMNVYSYLALHDPPRYGWVYDSLVDRAVRTHECYATYVALLVVADGCPNGILTSTDDYWCYTLLALQLTRGLKSLFLQYHALTALARICMQPDCIESILTQGLDVFRPSALRARDYPDARLEEIRKFVTAPFWKAGIDQAIRTSRGLAGWDALQAERLSDGPGQLMLPKEYDSLSRHVMHVLYSSLAAELCNRGMSTLTFNGHQAYTERLISAVADLVPPEQRVESIPRAVSTESDDGVLISSFGRERLVLSEKRLPAMMFRFADVPLQRRQELVTGVSENEHLFIVSRFPDRLTQQYEFPESTEAALLAARSKPVMALRRSAVVNGERHVELFVLEDTHDCDALIATFDEDMPFVTNLSLATMMVSPFVTQWMERLRNRGQISVLFDRYPFAHFDKWAQRGSPDILYTTIRTEVDGAVRFAFACQPQTGRSPIFLLPCSEALCGALCYYVHDIIHPRNLFKNDRAFVEDEAWWISLTIGHVFREEVVFDCTAKAADGGMTS